MNRVSPLGGAPRTVRPALSVVVHLGANWYLRPHDLSGHPACGVAPPSLAHCVDEGKPSSSGSVDTGLHHDGRPGVLIPDRQPD